MLHRNKKFKRIGFLFFLLGLLITACGSPQTAETQPTPSPVVEYGASLSEWEEAVSAAEGSQSSASNTNNASSAAPQATPTLALTAPTVVSQPSPRMITVTEDGFWELQWEDLVPIEFRPEAIMAKYQEQLSQYQDGDPQAMVLYMDMQEEFNNAPVNGELDEKKVKLPGFIAPLDYTDDLITEFLLVPYFGACIHVPPPPINQTVYVKTTAENGIKAEDSFGAIWVYGILAAEGPTTDLAQAGYSIEEATIEPYSP